MTDANKDNAKNELDKLTMQLKGHGVAGPSKIRLWAASPKFGENAIILNWDEPDEQVFQAYAEMMYSSMLEDYSLEEPPGQGVWVFEGTVTVTYSRGGDPFEPQDWDSDISWEGEWRPPNDDENSGWAAHEAEHVTKDYEGQGSTNAGVEIFQEPTFVNPAPLAYKDGKAPKDSILTAPYTEFNALDKINHAVEESKKAEVSENIKKGLDEAKKTFAPGYDTPPRRNRDFCDCGKHVSECCCGESHGGNHHPSGRGYDEEDYEQFYK